MVDTPGSPPLFFACTCIRERRDPLFSPNRLPIVRTILERVLRKAMRYRKHVFVCTHERPVGPKPSCKAQHGLDLIGAFRQELARFEESGTIRVQKSGCLDLCEHGPTVVVYPDGIFYGNVHLKDVPEIVEEHLIHDRPVERLVIP